MEDILGRPEFAITELGIIFRRPVDFDIWQILGEKLMFYHAGLQWMLGDWLLYGEKASWSEQFAQALDSFQIEYSTLMNYRRVASIFPIGARFAGVSWSHHREVAELNPEQQRFWLKSAAENKWSIRDMIQHMVGGTTGDGAIDNLLSATDGKRKVLKSLMGLSQEDQVWVIQQAAEKLGLMISANGESA